MFLGGNEGIVENCENNENIISDRKVELTSNYVGGIIGYAKGCKTIKNCTNKGDVLAQQEYRWNDAGGICAYLYGADANTNVENCINYGSISGIGAQTYMVQVGGMVGDAICTTILKNCYNSGDVYGSNASYVYIGGMLGRVESEGNVSNGVKLYLSVTHCYSCGEVKTDSVLTLQKKGAIGGTVTSNGVENTYYYNGNDESLKALNGADYEDKNVYGINEKFESLEQFLDWVNKQQ